MLIATTLWFTFTLNQNFSTSCLFKVNYKNIPENKLPIAPLTSKLEGEIIGNGWNLMRYLYDNEIKTIEADLSQVEGIYLKEDILISLINDELPKNIQITQIVPKQIPVIFENRFNKKIPVKLNADLNFSENYYPIGKMKLSPDSITVGGPETIINALNFWETDTLSLNTIKSNLEGKISLKESDQFNIVFTEKEINYSLEVEQFTEKKLKIPINLINLNEGDEIVILPKQVDLSCTLPISLYDEVLVNDFVIEADYKNNRRKDIIILTLVKQPAFLKDVHFHPASVEFIKYQTEE